MQFPKVLISTLLVASTATSSTIPTKDIAVISRKETLSPETSLSVRIDADISPRLATLPRVVLASLGGTVTVGAAACGAAVVPACIAAVVVLGVESLLFAMFYLYKEYQLNDPGLPARDIETHTVTLHAEYIPTTECDLLCQLNSPIFQTWTSIGNVTSITNSTVYNFHYRHVGTVHGVRVLPYANSSSVGRRQSDDRDGDSDGIVLSYYWEDGNLSRSHKYSDWDVGDWDPPIAQDIANYIGQTQSSVICAELEDSEGGLNAAILTTDVNDEETIYSDTDLGDYLNYCAAGDGLKL